MEQIYKMDATVCLIYFLKYQLAHTLQTRREVLD